jgi:hypothetical protein
MRQRIDPFISVAKTHRPLKGQYGAQYLKKPGVIDSAVSGRPANDAHGSSTVSDIDHQRYQHRKSIDDVARVPRLQREEYIPRAADETKALYEPLSAKDKPI